MRFVGPHMADADDVLAAEYVLGALSSETMVAVEARIARDPDFAALVEAWRRDLAPLDKLATPVDPPRDLFDNIMAKVDQIDPAPPQMLTRRADEGHWRPLSKAVQVRELWHDPSSGRIAFMMRIEPGGRYRGHHHDHEETCYVLEGDVAFGNLVLRAGDFHVALPGSDHPSAISKSGCLLLIHRTL